MSEASPLLSGREGMLAAKDGVSPATALTVDLFHYLQERTASFQSSVHLAISTQYQVSQEYRLDRQTATPQGPMVLLTTSLHTAPWSLSTVWGLLTAV